MGQKDANATITKQKAPTVTVSSESTKTAERAANAAFKLLFSHEATANADQTGRVTLFWAGKGKVNGYKIAYGYLNDTQMTLEITIDRIFVFTAGLDSDKTIRIIEHHHGGWLDVLEEAAARATGAEKTAAEASSIPRRT